MNEKLRGTLRTAWDEPRHFFFWLAILSFGGLIAAAGGAALTRPTLLLVFVLLGCIACFAAGIAGFMLLWIRPGQRLLSWLLRRRFLVLGCLAILLVPFYTIENWRGRRAWQDFKREREAKGERFDLASLAPPPVPNEQNFFETPLWKDLRFAATNGTVVWSDTNWENHVFFNLAGPKGEGEPGAGNWARARRADLAAWQAFYRGSNSISADDTAQQAFRRRYGLEERGMAPAPPPSGPPTNYFPVAKEHQSPAADVLLALSKYREDRQLLIAAAARPQARFWINYEAGSDFGVGTGAGMPTPASGATAGLLSVSVPARERGAGSRRPGNRPGGFETPVSAARIHPHRTAADLAAKPQQHAALCLAAGLGRAGGPAMDRRRLECH